MAAFGVTIRQVGRLYDQRRVEAAILRPAERAQVRTLFKVGAFIRQIAKSNEVLRRRKRPSKPGQTPSVHSTGPRSLRNIQFAVNRLSMYVVIGPALIGERRQAIRPIGTTVPGLFEHSGNVSIMEMETFTGRWFIPRRPVRGRRTRRRRARVRARPFMEKAGLLAVEKSVIPDAFLGSVGRIR